LGAQIGAIASGRFAGLAAQGITHLDATDNAYDLSLAQAKAVAAAGLTLAAGDQVRLNVSLAELALVSAADLALMRGLGIAQIASPDPVIALSGAQLQVLMASGLALPAAAHVVLADTMDNLSAAALPMANLTALRAYGVDEVQLRDTGAALGGLTYAQAASLGALGVTEIVATSPATLSLPRLIQLATLGVHFADASDMSVSLGANSLNPDTLDLGLLDQLNIDRVDLRENVAALTYGDLQAYQAAHLGFAVEDQITARLTLSEAQWLEPGADQALRAMGVDVLRVELTAAQVQNLSPTEIADLGARGITALDVTDNAARISLEQWQAIQAAHLQTAAEDRITVIQPLTLVADSATGREHDTLRVAVLANDSLPQGASLVGAFVTSGQGTVVLNADGTLSVAYAGADIDGPQNAQVTVRYTVFDGVQTSSADLTLRFTAQNENITGTGHADWLVGGAYGEQIRGGGGNDTIEGQGGNDSINAGAGDDTIIVGTTHGQDRINGGDGIDTLVISRFATQGPLTLSLQDPGLMQSLGGGTTVLNVERLDYKGTNLGTDRITGGALADRIAGNAGDDVLAGGGGADQLYGGSGNDVLTGGAGADVLYGGLGQDVFVFTAADLGGTDLGVTDLGVTDQIRDFKAAEGDLVDLSALEGLEWIGTAAFTGQAKELRFAAAPGATLVQADLDGDGLSDLVIALQAGVTLREVDFLL
jgi:serralysin